MSYLGNAPALAYTSFAKQDFSTSATTTYTLDNPVANANELALFINFVRQEPTTAYSASGTTLTLTSATSSSDDMYCVYLGKAVQTVNPPNASVGASQIVDASITSAKLASGVLPTNTPSFRVHPSSGQNISSGTWTKITFDTETWDTDNAFASNKFTVPSGKDGKYVFSYAGYYGSIIDQKIFALRLYKNGSEVNRTYVQQTASGTSGEIPNASVVISLSAGDYVEVYIYQNNGSDRTLDSNFTRFEGFKLIGV